MGSSLNDLLKLVTEGGDSRIELIHNGNANKYFVRPLDYDGFFNRGSCTCSSLNEESLSHLESIDLDREDLFQPIHNQLKSLINFEGQDKFDVFIAPSGSDLTYFPLLFSKILYPNKEICSLVSCPEELGSGTIKAASGKYFMSKNQFGEKINEEDLLFDREVKTLTVPARDEVGNIIDHRKELLHHITASKEYSRIGFLVVGSKSGIENDIEVVNDVKDDMLWVVDLCQFRNRKKFINELLDMNCMIMITGSKFYQSPPFCGALLVPKKITNKLAKQKIESIEPFAKLFSKDNIPSELPSLRRHFRAHRNLGLALRWECAMHEMSKFDKLSFQLSSGAMTNWHNTIIEAILKSPYLEAMPSQDQTNDTIISFRARIGDTFLNPAETRALFESIVKPEYENEDFKRIFIGQPVNYGEKSFLRLAIGSYDLRKLIDKDMDYTNDLRLIEIIEERIQEMATLIVPSAIS